MGSRRPNASNYVLLTVCVMYLIFYMDRVNISTAASVIQKDLGLSATALGAAFSAVAYPYAFFQIAGGWLGDRLMSPIVFGAVIGSLGILLIGAVVALFIHPDKRFIDPRAPVVADWQPKQTLT